jgi:hypothetical protein
MMMAIWHGTAGASGIMRVELLNKAILGFRIQDKGFRAVSLGFQS